MAETYGYGVVSIIPSARGFGRLLERQIGGQSATAGRAAGGRLGSGMLGGLKGLAGPLAAVAGGAAIAGIIKSSVDIEKSYSLTMRQIAANTGAPQAEMKELSKLAKQLGADTQYSAGEAAEAMLELSKSGLTPAQIQAGALAGTMKLAAAGGTELGTAATIAVNSMAGFGLKAKDVDSVVTALAGGANASTASVESLGNALSQVGPGAANAGLTLQDTVGTLAAFDSNALSGSDAGTSLKTMLARLVPDTEKASSAFEDLGLNFVNADGSFKSVTEIAGQLHDNMKDLSESERTAALNTMFGSDASRAAYVLMKEGSAGIGKYVKATKNRKAADDAAKAAMEGSSGAIERMSGALDTAKLSLGELVAPAVVKGADLLGAGFESVGGMIDGLKPSVGPVAEQIKGMFKGSAGGGLMTSLKDTWKVLSTEGKKLTPVITKFAGTFRDTLMPGLRSVGDTLTKTFLPAFRSVLPILRPVAAFILGILGGAVIGVLKGAFRVINGVLQTIAGVFNLIKAVVTGDWAGMWAAIKQILGGALKAVVGAVQVWLNLGILAIFKRGLFSLVGLFRGIPGRIGGIFAGLGRLLLRIVKGTFTNLVKGATGGLRLYIRGWKLALQILWYMVRQIFLRVVGYVTGTMYRLGRSVGKLKDSIARAFTGLRTSVSNTLGKIVEAVTGLPAKLLTGIDTVTAKLAQIGKKIVEGIAKGITDGASWAIDAIRGLADTMIQKFKDKFKIFSPSRVMSDLMGNVAEGAVVGLKDGQPKVAKAMGDLVPIPKVAGAGAAVAASVIPAQRTGPGAVSAGGTPLIGTLNMTSTGKVRDDMAEISYQLRRAKLGGVHSGRR